MQFDDFQKLQFAQALCDLAEKMAMWDKIGPVYYEAKRYIKTQEK